MAATRQDVDRWIEEAKKNNQPFIISVCDTFDYDDYPIFCKTINELKERYKDVNGVNMQRINEIIKINPDGSVENSRLLDILEVYDS